MTPTQLAAELGLDPRSLREWIRMMFPNCMPNTWLVPPHVIHAARLTFGPPLR